MDHRAGKRRRLRIGRASCVLAAFVAAWFSNAPVAHAVTPQSPEVKELVDKGLKYLSEHTDQRLGGRCLIGLAFLKADRRDHARVGEAVKACQEQIKANPPDSMLDMYSNGLAIIFLCELSPEKYSKEINWYLERMKRRQKSHGGWGYDQMPTGDTSQTQYAALSFWEAHRRGFGLEAGSLEKLVDWLQKTQDPHGCWGYQGQVSTTGKPIEQNETNPSMLAAGLGCVYICADLFGMTSAQQASEAEQAGGEPLPEALRAADRAQKEARPKLRTATVSASDLGGMMHRAHAWMKENYQIDIGPKVFYYLYGLERYKSFEEAHSGIVEEEPKWYNDGYKFLRESQTEDGSWRGYCGNECDTAFSILFLLRSTQKALRARLGDGTLLAGRGLPSNLKRAKLRNGQIFVEQVSTRVDALLSMIDDEDQSMLDELARDPSQLIVEEVDEKSARRLQQLVRGGDPEIRLLAVRALGRTGNLDYVPSLLYALTDPDRRVVIEARDGLKFISRNFEGLGPPNDFTDQQRYQAVDAWTKWYRSLRPAAARTAN